MIRNRKKDSLANNTLTSNNHVAQSIDPTKYQHRPSDEHTFHSSTSSSLPYNTPTRSTTNAGRTMSRSTKYRAQASLPHNTGHIVNPANALFTSTNMPTNVSPHYNYPQDNSTFMYSMMNHNPSTWSSTNLLSQQAPSVQQQAPLVQQHASSIQQQVPTDSQQVPTDSQQVPTDSQQVPLDQTQVSLDQTQVSLNQIQSSLEKTQVSTDSKQEVTTNEAIETETKQPARTEPVHSHTLVNYHVTGGKGWQRVIGYSRATDIQPIQTIKHGMLYAISFSHSGIGTIPKCAIYICKNRMNSEAPSDESEHVVSVIRIENDINGAHSFTLFPGEVLNLNPETEIIWEASDSEFERGDRVSIYAENLSGSNIELYIEY